MASLEYENRSISPSLAGAVGRVLDASSDPVRTAFLARALNALARLTPEIGDDVLGDAAGAESDYGVLVRALAAPSALGAMSAGDPLMRARLRGLVVREEILRREGGTLTADEVATHLGLSRQAVDKRRRAGKLLGLSVGRRGYAYPAWQLGREGVLPGLEAALTSLKVYDPWMRAAFFLSGDPRLNGATPLEELRRGNIEAVRRAASAYGEHGAA